MGGDDGSFQIRHRTDLEKELRVYSHDIDSGKVRSIQLARDKKAVVSASYDGGVMVYRLDYPNIMRTFNGELFIRY